MTAEFDAISHNSFRSDQPVLHREDDKLNRAAFAERLAHAIQGWEGNESLVIALYGPWGSGKSSLKNFMLEALTASDSQSMDVVDLSVWQFANRERISATFFDQLGIALGRGSIESQSDRAALVRRWSRYADYLTSAGAIANHVRTAGIAIAIVAGVLFAGSTFLPALRAASMVAAAGMFAIAALFRWSAGFSSSVVDLLSVKVRDQKSIKEMRSEIQEALTKRPAPLLVILDDLDRLSPAETVEVLQLVKANADFRGVVFLLLCEREIVEKHVDELLHVSGREYLEKIVQVAFSVPMIERQQLHTVLFEGLERILGFVDTDEEFDKNRWGNLFHGALEPYFQTLRHVYRFLSTFAFHVSLFRLEGGLEVNPVDLIGLEVLRVFEPEVYRALPQNRSLLTNSDYILHNAQQEALRKEEMGQILNLASSSHREMAREIIKQLFPHTARFFGGATYADGFEEGWFREHRVCAPALFSRYFGFAIPIGDISRSVLDRLLAASPNRSDLRGEFELLAQQNLLEVALERFEAYKEQIPLENTESLITAIFDIGDLLPRSTGLMFDRDPAGSAIRIVYWHLRKVPDATTRLTALKSGLASTTGLRLPIDLVSLAARLSARASEGGPTEPDIVDSSGLESLKVLCLEVTVQPLRVIRWWPGMVARDFQRWRSSRARGHAKVQEVHSPGHRR